MGTNEQVRLRFVTGDVNLSPTILMLCYEEHPHETTGTEVDRVYINRDAIVKIWTSPARRDDAVDRETEFLTTHVCVGANSVRAIRLTKREVGALIRWWASGIVGAPYKDLKLVLDGASE